MSNVDEATTKNEKPDSDDGRRVSSLLADLANARKVSSEAVHRALAYCEAVAADSLLGSEPRPGKLRSLRRALRVARDHLDVCLGPDLERLAKRVEATPETPAPLGESDGGAVNARHIRENLDGIAARVMLIQGELQDTPTDRLVKRNCEAIEKLVDDAGYHLVSVIADATAAAEEGGAS